MQRVLGAIPSRLTVSICATVLAATAVGLPAHASGTLDHVMARQARKMYLSENAQLRFTHEDGSALVEHGSATGTYNAPVTAILTIHPTSVTAIVTLFPKGGSLTGTAQANYIVKGSIGYFGGTLRITGGTGTYRHASGKALGISGTINRENFNMTVKAHGEINL
jgi:hypothetical protein